MVWDGYTVGRAMGRYTGEMFTVGRDGDSVDGEEAADNPDLFYEGEELYFLFIRLLDVAVKHHSSLSLQNGLCTYGCYVSLRIC
jgi:hypothetical protein